MSRLPQMMTLGDIAFHDVTQELLEESRITLAQVTREPPVIQIGGERGGAPFARRVGQIFRL